MTLEQLAQLVNDLANRVAALEATRAPTRRQPSPSDVALVQSLIDRAAAGGQAAGAGTIVYAGAGHGPTGLSAFQVERTWNELLDADPAPLAMCLAAFAHPLRIQILQMLAREEMATADLADALGAASSGQLFHHLKELLAAGLINQPSRGRYAVRIEQMIPLLTALSSAFSLAEPADPVADSRPPPAG